MITVRYLGGSRATFMLSPDGRGGTDVHLRDEDIPDEELPDVRPRWVSVLMALKACLDHGVDLRNHDSGRTWDQGYCDN